jgi:hypothetical protein
VLVAQPTSGEGGHHLGADLTADEGLEHRPARGPDDVGGDRSELYVCAPRAPSGSGSPRPSAAGGASSDNGSARAARADAPG